MCSDVDRYPTVRRRRLLVPLLNNAQGVDEVEMSAVDTPNRTGWAMRFHIQRSDKGLQIPNRYPSVTDIV